MNKIVSFSFVRNLLVLLAAVAFGWLALRTLNNTYTNVMAAWDPALMGSDPGEGWKARLERIRADLPPRGVVGYISEKDIPGLDYNDIDTNIEYAMTQYFLSPLIVQRSAEHEYVVANIVTEQFDPAVVEERFGLELFQDYGFGIFLFKGGDQ